MNRIVLDIETQNLFADVGGKENLTKLSLSMAGVYSYTDNAFLTFTESEVPEFEKLLKNTNLVIGFNTNHFDLPILQKYFSFDLSKIQSLDIMEDVINSVGHRVSLDDLLTNTLNAKKSANGLLAVQYWREGRIEELRKYCLNDVRLTRDLYEHGLKNGQIKFTARDANLPYTKTIRVNWAEYSNFQSNSAWTPTLF